jgi:2,4-dienoyl-CoA reductase-like NADH-dependent reductase (Old Yellow Enzyme family)
LDFVDLSGGTIEGRAFEQKKESTKAREAYFIEFAETIRPHLPQTKIYVTGGFRTLSGMTRALEANACDGIGISRPLAAEQYLCKEILERRVTGALQNLVPLPQNPQASSSQLHQLGRGQEKVSDWSQSEELGRWMRTFEKDEEERASMLSRVERCGYPVLKAEMGSEYLK